jgi:hypothetical protein
MSILIVVSLIRVLFVLGMICLLMVAGALLARRETRRASNPEAPSNPWRRPAAIQPSLHDPATRGQPEANDSATPAPGFQRRAA